MSDTKVVMVFGVAARAMRKTRDHKLAIVSDGLEGAIAVNPAGEARHFSSIAEARNFAAVTENSDPRWTQSAEPTEIVPGITLAGRTKALWVVR